MSARARWWWASRRSRTRSAADSLRITLRQTTLTRRLHAAGDDVHRIHLEPSPMATRYYLTLPDPQAVRGTDGLRFTANGAEEFAAQLQDALRTTNLFERWRMA